MVRTLRPLTTSSLSLESSPRHRRSKPATELPISSQHRYALAWRQMVNAYHFGLDEQEFWKNIDQFRGTGSIEERLDSEILPLVKKIRSDGRQSAPDLVEIGSGMFDLARWARQDIEAQRSTEEPLTVERIGWYASRMNKFMDATAQAFPKATKLWRAVTMPDDQSAELDYFHVRSFTRRSPSIPSKNCVNTDTVLLWKFAGPLRAFGQGRPCPLFAKQGTTARRDRKGTREALPAKIPKVSQGFPIQTTRVLAGCRGGQCKLRDGRLGQLEHRPSNTLEGTEGERFRLQLVVEPRQGCPSAPAGSTPRWRPGHTRCRAVVRHDPVALGARSAAELLGSKLFQSQMCIALTIVK